MVTVYLDQAQWIDLGRARHGRVDGARFVNALDVARQVVSMGLAQFPLSTGHYIETWRQGNPARRRRLAATMVELSQGRTLARPPDLCDNELDAFISTLSGMVPSRVPWPPLGWGFGHASGLTPNMPRSQIVVDIELEQLAQRPHGFLAHGRGHQEFGDLYRDGEQGLAVGGDLRAHSAATHEAIIAASAVMEIYENIGWALERAGLSADTLGPIGLTRPDLPQAEVAEVLNALLPVARGFIAALPTRDAALRLRLLRHQDRTTHWKSNDMVDIAYTACAVVHCDVVVTEKRLVHELKRSGLLEQHNTRTLQDVADLPQVLVELTSDAQSTASIDSSTVPGSSERTMQ